MHVLNAAESSQFFDSIGDERADSAVTVLHGAWLEHSTPVGQSERLESDSPLDMLVLYRAAAATFEDWPSRLAVPDELYHGGHVINWEKAKTKLHSVNDPEIAALATRFANLVIGLSENSASEQDLNYFVELFLRSLEDKRVIEAIASGSIAKHSKQLSNPDFW